MAYFSERFESHKDLVDFLNQFGEFQKVISINCIVKPLAMITTEHWILIYMSPARIDLDRDFENLTIRYKNDEPSVATEAK